MADPITQAVQVAVGLVADWVERERGIRTEIAPPERVERDLPVAFLTAGDQRIAVAVAPLYDVEADADTQRRKAAVEERLATIGAGPVAVWVPPGAGIPMDDADAFVARIAEATAGRPPGERVEVAFPVTLDLRKNDDKGSYLSVFGGLSPHWARFTNQVMGYYQLDSSAIHRLPDDPEKVTQLIDFIVLVANGLRAPGQTAEVKAEDTWVAQQVRSLSGPCLLAAAPGSAPDDGAGVRRALRAGVQRAAQQLPALAADTRVLAFVGIYHSLRDENALVALRGMDPTAFASLDFACLVADGGVKPLLGPRPGTTLAT